MPANEALKSSLERPGMWPSRPFELRQASSSSIRLTFFSCRAGISHPSTQPSPWARRVRQPLPPGSGTLPPTLATRARVRAGPARADFFLSTPKEEKKETVDRV